MAWTPEVFYYLGLGALQVLLAVVLLRLRFLDRANRALALLLILRGTSHLTRNVALGLEGGGPWFAISSHLLLAYFVSIGYFVAVYPRPRKWLPHAPWGAVPFLALMAVLSLLFAARAFAAPDGSLPWFADAAEVGETIFPIAALVLAADALRMPSGPRRSSVLLVGAALTLIDLSDNAARLLLIAQARFDEPHLLDLPGVALRVLLFAALTVLLLREERRTADSVLRRGLRGYLLAIAIAVASAPLAVALETPTPGPDGAVTAAWDVALPLLLVYALLRHQLFDIDLKVKWTIRQSTLAAAFIGVFFIVSEGAQQFLADDQGGLGFGPYFGIAATGLLVFALAPLQQAAERVANAALPNARSPEQMTRDERCTVYRQQAALAWADGTLSLDERQLLDGLRQHLGLPAEEAARLEAEVTGHLRQRAA